MIVSELLEALKGMDPNAEIILPSDPEGNSYRPLSAIDTNSILLPGNPESLWASEPQIMHPDWSANEACQSEEEWAETLKLPRCIVLWP